MLFVEAPQNVYCVVFIEYYWASILSQIMNQTHTHTKKGKMKRKIIIRCYTNIERSVLYTHNMHYNTDGHTNLIQKGVLKQILRPFCVCELLSKFCCCCCLLSFIINISALINIIHEQKKCCLPFHWAKMVCTRAIE